MCSRSVLIKCMCFVLLATTAFSQEQAKQKIKRHKKNLSTIQHSIARVDREILTLTKGIRELQKRQAQTIAVVAKHQQSIKETKIDAVSQSIAKQISLLRELTSAMENTSQLHAYNEQLQVESKKMQRLIQVKKQINSEVLSHKKQIAQHKKHLGETAKKMRVYKSILAKTIHKRKILDKNAAIYKKQLSLAAQEYVELQKQEKKRKLLALYAAKKKREAAERKKREMAERKKREEEKKKRALAYRKRQKNSRDNRNREKPNDLEEETIATLLLLNAAEDTAEDVADTTEDATDDARRRIKNKASAFLARKQNPKDGAWMVRVGSFWVYEKPISNAQYWQSFRGMYYNNAQKNNAVTQIAFRDAQEYARWAGASLPTYTQLQKLPKKLSGNSWEWTKSTYRKKSAHVIYNKVQKPRLLADAREHAQVTFRLILPAK